MWRFDGFALVNQGVMEYASPDGYGRRSEVVSTAIPVTEVTDGAPIRVVRWEGAEPEIIQPGGVYRVFQETDPKKVCCLYPTRFGGAPCLLSFIRLDEEQA